jgi:CRP/FNR family transcriptional regulator
MQLVNSAREEAMTLADLVERRSALPPGGQVSGAGAVRSSGLSARFRPECASCPVRAVCLPAWLRGDRIRLLDYVVMARRAIHRGQVLYRAGDACEAIYPIRAGFFKTTVVSRNGDEHVIGLRLAGDVLGLDGVGACRYSADAVALDHGEVCVVPYANLLDQSLHSGTLQNALVGIMGREITREQDLLLLLGGMWGVERLAAFLLDVSHRLRAHGYSPSDFQLRMTRREIGSYLGMELETVSRIFSRLEREGLLVADRGHVTILDLDGLARLAQQEETSRK